MFIFSNNKYFAILLGQLELHTLLPLRSSICPWNKVVFGTLHGYPLVIFRRTLLSNVSWPSTGVAQALKLADAAATEASHSSRQLLAFFSIISWRGS